MDKEDSTSVIAGVKTNDRYFVTLISIFVLIVLLLFIRDLPEWMKNVLIPALVAYTMGTCLIAQLQNMVGNRTELQCKARNREYEGTPKGFFWGAIIPLHALWFLGFLIYLYLNK